MSRIEHLRVSCDVRKCRAMAVDPGQDWIMTGTLDLCPEHATASGLTLPQADRAADAASAEIAGTVSPAGVTVTMPANLARVVAIAVRDRAQRLIEASRSAGVQAPSYQQQARNLARIAMNLEGATE